MGQYKVPQNVEAEDKIIGPLTFKQFIYALIGFGWGAISFAIFRFFPPVLILVGLPPVILFLLLAFYNRDGQNFEQLLIALVGYFANPRRRLWRKEEAVMALRIEPPKAVVEQTQRNPAEVRSELDRLADLVDSRGWNKPTEERPIAPITELGELESEIKATQDILDLQHSPAAQNLNLLIQQAAIEFAFQGFLNSLHFPIQIVVRSQKIDLDPYIEKLKNLRSEQGNELLALLMDDYIANISSLVEEVNIMDKQFYIVIPYFP